ncbi:MAG: NifB/NifX family molybdenum-iron cluster-binding protein [Sedimentibacter sp.]|uniref:NifB/NifX family molybdenum-iron cluster-binding protein n=1 Tax=Sedimentibacter sp. TaxID=1960295 RepID=UPI002981EADC|nr:NifB/NifX family molybdenum-iron cluster-binding protein [Sedimentibacter sp.]MDW5300616.1 NifB/NifX family molybdenum-iron cluster-binding protein [Sedimentibacter sp.]
MKIAIPVNEASMESNICISFGRAPYYLIYETDTKESTFLNNIAATSQGGAGIRAAQSLVDNNIEALIVPRSGGNAADVINQANIKMYKTINDSISDNINAFNEGKLILLNEIHAGFHNHGGK